MMVIIEVQYLNLVIVLNCSSAISITSFQGNVSGRTLLIRLRLVYRELINSYQRQCNLIDSR